MLLLCALVGSITSVWADAVASAVPEDGKSYVVAVYVNNKYYALPNGAVTSGTISGTEVSLNSANKISTSDATGKSWTLEEDETPGQFYLKYTNGTDTYYLYKNGTSGTNYKFAVNKTSKNYWKFTSNGTAYTVEAVDRGTNNLNIQYNSSAFRCYSSASPIILLEIGNAAAYTITTAVNNADMGSVSLSGTTITATPNAGYRVKAGDDGYTVTSGTANVTNNGDNTFTVDPTSTCTIQINFEAIPSHKVTFSVNGDITEQNVAEGADVVFPANPADLYGKTFVGWTTSAIAETTNTAPVLVNAAVMGENDLMFYAVFAKALTGVQNYTIGTNTTGFPTSYSNETDYTFDGVQFNIHQMMYNSSNSRIQFKTSAGKIYNKTPLLKLQSVVVTYTSDDSNKNLTLKVGMTENPTEGTSITPTSNGLVYTFDTSEGNYNYFLLANGTGVGYITSIVFNYYGYKSFCTTVSSKLGADLAYAAPSYKLAPDILFTPTLTNPHNLVVTYSSNDDDIATVDENTGQVLTGDKIGTATITAYFAGNDTYDEGSATYTITTYNPNVNDGSEAKPYTVTEALALINTLGSESSDPVYVKGKVNEVIEYHSSYHSLTYNIEDLDDNTKVLKVYSGKNLGRANFTGTSDLTVGDELIIYGALKMYNTTPEILQNNYISQKKHGSEPEVKSLDVKAAEYRTYVASANLIVPTGVTAYIATGETATELTLTSVPKIKAGTPVILNAAEGYYSFQITDEEVTYPATNLLKISDGTVVNGAYVLAKKNDVVGFYKWAGGALSPGKVYVEPSSAAREFIGFNFDEVTGINEVKNEKETVNGIFDLQGRKVITPSKGLYIVNGKKVVIK